MPEREPPPEMVALQPTNVGVGENADGTLNIFPASELAAREAARDSEDAAWSAAVEQDQEDPSDISDLDELRAQTDLDVGE